MVQKREAYAPWSLTRKAGVQSATVNGDIEVPQFIQPVLDTGFVDEKGDWKGSKSSDEQFFAFGKDEAVANGGEILAPQASGTVWPLDMTGFSTVLIGIKVTNAGTYTMRAIMGPNDLSFANLNPINPASTLRGMDIQDTGSSFHDLMSDAAETIANHVWVILMIQNRLAGQKLLQFSITNNSGNASDIETAFMRLV